jgi:hypothetical protein
MRIKHHWSSYFADFRHERRQGPLRSLLIMLSAQLEPAGPGYWHSEIRGTRAPGRILVEGHEISLFNKSFPETQFEEHGIPALFNKPWPALDPI